MQGLRVPWIDTIELADCCDEAAPDTCVGVVLFHGSTKSWQDRGLGLLSRDTFSILHVKKKRRVY